MKLFCLARRFRWELLVLFLVSLLWFGFSGEAAVLAFESPPVDPAPPGGAIVVPEEMETIPGFLGYLAGPSSFIVVGTLLSLLLDQSPWYAEQSVAVKRMIPVVAATLISSVAHVLLAVVPTNVWQEIAPFWTILVGAVATFLGGELRYLLTRAKRDARDARDVAASYLTAPHEE